MKREILFRGKRMDNGKWEYGFLSWNDSPRKRSYHINNDVVYSETVGQFTGLTDKNGTKIFEGNIVKSWNSEYERPLICEYIHEYSCFAFIDKADYNNQYFWNFNDCSKSEVIGNVHDNPELLK